MTALASDVGIIAIRSELPALADVQHLDPTDEQAHRTVLDYVHAMRKRVEERRVAITKPMLQAKREADAFFAELSAPIDQAIALCKSRLAAIAETRKAAELAAREAEIVRISATTYHALDGTPLTMPAVVIAPVPSPPPPVSGASFVWEAEVTDHAQVPRDFLCVDTRAIDAYAKRFAKSEHIPAIPGVVFRRKASIRSGSR